MSSTTSPILTFTSMHLHQMTPDDNGSHWWNSNASDAGNGTTTPGPPTMTPIESYTLFKVIEVMSTYYLWFLLALGVPGNIASIFTIVTMPTVSSSKVKNIPLYGPSNGVVPHVSDVKSSRARRLDLANGNDDNDLRQLVSTKEKEQHKHKARHMSITAAHPLAAHVAILAMADTWGILLKITYNQISLKGHKLTAPGCATIMFLQQFFTSYVNWVVVAMTIERFVAVWFPLRVGRIYTRKKASCVLGLFAAITAALFICFFWAWTERHEPGYGYWCSVKQEYAPFIYKTFYWVEAVYTSLLPCYLVLTGNALIIKNIRKARRAQRHLTNAFDQGGRTARDQKQITIMLIVVSVVFLILNLPNAVVYIIKINWEYEPQTYEHVIHIFVTRFVQILMNCNHAVNFYLYFLSMSTFRRRFLDAIRCRRSARRRPTGSMYRTSQTYVQSGHLSETSRTEMSGRYINAHSLKRNSSNADSHHSLKSCSSGNNARLSIHTDNSSHVTANSEV